jgi:hypothetical protein
MNVEIREWLAPDSVKAIRRALVQWYIIQWLGSQ